MLFCIILISVSMLISFWNLIIAILGLFPRFLATAVGTLTKCNTHKNVPTKHGGRIPHLTRYTYVYTVNGKKYSYSAEGYHSKRRLYPKASMVFVKWFPRHAYPNKFKGTSEWTLGLFMLTMGLLFIFVLVAT